MKNHQKFLYITENLLIFFSNLFYYIKKMVEQTIMRAIINTKQNIIF